MGKLDGQVALVSGAARGLGRAYALRLANLGADVGVIDLDLHSYREYPLEAARTTAGDVVSELVSMGVRGVGREVDVSSAEGVRHAIGEIAEELGDISILVANAGGGSGGWQGYPSNFDLTEMQTIMERNFYGTVHQVQAVVPAMKKRQSGKIVTVSSQSGLHPSAGGVYAHYAAAKAAITIYTQCLAQELAPNNIGVNCIAPGYVATGRLMELVGSNSDSILANIPAGRFGTVEDCANVIEFLTTDLSSYVTGAVIDVAGGYRGSGNLTGRQ